MKKILLSLLLLSNVCTAQMYYPYKNCLVAGDNPRFALVDSQKNRGIASDKYQSINFDYLANLKFTETIPISTGVQIQGYIVKMEKSGKESCNCHSDVNIDTHIYLSKDKDYINPSDCIIVEVTPRFRELLGDLKTLKSKYLNHQVTVYGYLFCDEEHKASSRVDNGKGLIWRSSLWEIHPITKIEIIN